MNKLFLAALVLFLLLASISASAQKSKLKDWYEAYKTEWYNMTGDEAELIATEIAPRREYVIINIDQDKIHVYKGRIHVTYTIRKFIGYDAGTFFEIDCDKNTRFNLDLRLNVLGQIDKVRKEMVVYYLY